MNKKAYRNYKLKRNIKGRELEREGKKAINQQTQEYLAELDRRLFIVDEAEEAPGEVFDNLSRLESK
jgi:DNA transposition AAA+ family ATPase